jgi:tRNA(Ile2)-agmatinylcytidine synthase
MHCLVGIDDTDSSRGYCTTYLAYRIACDLAPEVRVLPYPRLVRLNPNVPFKTRGNAAVSLKIEADDTDDAFRRVSEKVSELSDVEGGANSGVVFLDDVSLASKFGPLYLEALTGMVSPHRVRKLVRDVGAKSLELGNGMGIVGAASSLGFNEKYDHTYELIGYRKKGSWGHHRLIDSRSVKAMDAETFPHTFNNYDYQKRKALVAPHGPDPVFAGVRGDSPGGVEEAFRMLAYEEELLGSMVYITNQHTDAHLRGEVDWKVYSSGWLDGTVEGVEVGPGGHVYVTLRTAKKSHSAAFYEPTGDLRRVARDLSPGDVVRLFGGVRRATTLHPKVLNVEKIHVISVRPGGKLRRGVYVSSPRANRHLTKPLIRYGREDFSPAGTLEGWLRFAPRPLPVPA